MRTSSFVLSLALASAVALPLSAQGRGNSESDGNRSRAEAAASRARGGPASAQNRERHADARHQRIPPGHLPPPGMCRVWIDGVPPGRQSPPTDCATARRSAARGEGRVIYGSDARYEHGDRGRDRDDDRNRDARDCQYVWDWTCEDPRDRRDDDDDRWENDRRRDDDWCFDRNRDGRCDAVNGGGVYDRRRYPTTLPRMISGMMMQQGIRSPEVSRWLGEQRVTARYTDADRDRVPERVVWLDTAGRVLQVWLDEDRDGRADHVELYRNGRRAQVIR